MYDSRLIDKQLKPAFSLLTSLVPLSQPSLSCQTFRLKLSKHLDEIYSPAFGQKQMLNVPTWKILLKPFLCLEKQLYGWSWIPFVVCIMFKLTFQLSMKCILGMQVQYITYTLKHKFTIYNLYHECLVFRHARVRLGESFFCILCWKCTYSDDIWMSLCIMNECTLKKKKIFLSCK